MEKDFEKNSKVWFSIFGKLISLINITIGDTLKKISKFYLSGTLHTKKLSPIGAKKSKLQTIREILIAVE